MRVYIPYLFFISPEPISNTRVFIYVVYKGNNKITELRTILQRESQNS